MTTEYENSTSAYATSTPSQMVARREITVNNIKIHVNSIFTGQRKLDDALADIVKRRMNEKVG